MRNDLLQAFLAGESRAYGFTIAFWGSGALLINSFGVPTVQEVFLYASGAITGFAAVTLLAFSSFLEETGTTEDSNQLALGMVHYLAALGPLIATLLLTSMQSQVAFFLSGASVSIMYNILQLVEEHISERIVRVT